MRRLPRLDLAARWVGLLAVVVLGGAYFMQQRHPTVSSIEAHLEQQAVAGQVPHLSDAELEVLAEEGRKQATAEAAAEPRWERVPVPGGTPVVRLAAPGERTLHVGFEDGWLGVSDQRYKTAPGGPDPIDVLDEQRTVVAGGPGQAIVGGCCEFSDPPVTVVLRRGRPPLAAATRWPQSSEIDLDLATGALTLVTTGGPEAVVKVPKGRYRLRVSSAGATENEQEKDAYLFELWPRRTDTPLRVLRPTAS